MRRKSVDLWVCALTCVALAAWCAPVSASDACSGVAVRTSASVTVSDGSHFETETWFMAADHAAIRTRRANAVDTIAVEGPLAWAGDGHQARIADEAMKRFALGHQFHALWQYFAHLVPNSGKTHATLDGRTREARAGPFPHGGTLYLVGGDASGRPAGLRLDLPGGTPIEVGFDDWRTGDGGNLPWHVRIDDGERVFDYRYSRIDLTARPAGWFPAEVDAPDLDAVRIYRLHRALLAAHCDGDATAIARLSAPRTLVADRGQLSEISRDEILQRFRQVFSRLDYEAYHDVLPPDVEVSASGDIGWIAANVRAVGKTVYGGEPFDTQWAWIMPVTKIDGRWLQAGIAANRQP
ncbi:MAG: nuclear transport factor 2 family protein [Lysobacterales bacterium]